MQSSEFKSAQNLQGITNILYNFLECRESEKWLEISMKDRLVLDTRNLKCQGK
jgi:hypothetical protein